MAVSGVTTRPVDPEADLQPITDIYNHYVKSSTATFETRPLTLNEMRLRIESLILSNPFLVAEVDGKVAGFAYIHPWKVLTGYSPTCELTIYVREGITGHGVGNELMHALEDEIRRNYPNVVSLIACITADNTGSCRFHENHGFERVSYFRRVGRKFGKELDVADYQKFLRE